MSHQHDQNGALIRMHHEMNFSTVTMKITDARIKEFKIPLKHHLSVVTAGSDHRFDFRSGMYLVIHARTPNNGPVYEGVGEMVEPVFTSGDTPSVVLAAATRLLSAAIPLLETSSIDSSNVNQSLCAIIDKAVPWYAGMSVTLARFCIEQALLRLVSQALQLPLHTVIHQWLFPTRTPRVSPVRVHVNKMYNARAHNLCVANFGVVKLKVGGGVRTPAEDADMVNEVVSSCRNITKVRLDANQSWTLDEAGCFGSLLSEETIQVLEYIEEPVKVEAANAFILMSTINSLRSRYNMWNRIKICLDESLLFKGIDEVLQQAESLGIVYKPSLHGLGDIEIIKKFSNRVTISCTFETGIGLEFLTAVAAAINPYQSHGLFPLMEMVDVDQSTKDFLKSIEADADGGYILSG